MTHFQEIEEIIKTHPEIPQVVVTDVFYRCRCWLEMTDSNQMDSYIQRQRDYLLKWID